MSDSLSYTLRFPFRVASSHPIKDFPDKTEQIIDGYVWRFEWKEPYYVLVVSGFPQEEDAQIYAKRIWNGLTWTLLNKGIPFEATLTFDSIVYTSEPQEAAENLHKSLGLPNRGPVDGIVNNNTPVIYRSDKRIITIGMGDPIVFVSSPFTGTLSLIEEGMSARTNEHVDLDPKLQTALDLYSAYYYEQTSNARLLTLVMALEALMDDLPRHAVVLDLLKEWEPGVAAAKAACLPDSEEYLALESLERELFFKKYDSLRRQVRNLVYETLRKSVYEEVAMTLARKAVQVYDDRSSLVHDGFLPKLTIDRATADAKEIMELVLRAKFLDA